MTASALIEHKVAQGTSSTATTASGDTTGANFICVASAQGASATPTDNKSNGNATGLTAKGSNPTGRLWYWTNPAVGSGHTVTSPSVASSFPGIAWQAFSNVDTTSPFDVENGTGGSGAATLQPGSITPSADNAVVVCATSSGRNNVPTVDITLTDGLGFQGGVSYAIASARDIQTTAAASNPTWTFSGPGGAESAIIAAFKNATGGGGGGGFVPSYNRASRLLYLLM